MKRKSIYTKAHFGELTFAQMPHKDLDNLYKSSISFFLNFNNRKRVEIPEKCVLNFVENNFKNPPKTSVSGGSNRAQNYKI